MAPYQSFPDVAGDSLSLEKLKALRLPPLAGKHFLDVGCNEGFFCGFAAFAGAARSAGLDKNGRFIEAARARFPGCEFLERSWDDLPAGPFDVILLASALHYAEDQAALVQRLAGELAPGGTLVLELGVAGGPGSAWVEVKRGIDTRLFPTWGKLEEILAGHAWKHVGPSVPQHGDPVRRHVLHVTQRRPLAFLLMEPPAYGKSSICRSVFAKAGVRIVSGDQVLARLSQGKLEAPEELAAIVTPDLSPLRLDEATRRVFSAGLGGMLVGLWVGEAGSEDFAVDAYVPYEHHDEVEREVAERGYMPVLLQWGRVGLPPPSAEVAGRMAESYFESLRGERVGGGAGPDRPALPFRGTVGYVEQLTQRNGVLVARGWALHESGAMPSLLGVRVGGDLRVVSDFEKRLRPDVQKHFGLDHALVGYELTLPLVGDTPDLGDVEVCGGNDTQSLLKPFRRAASVQPGR